MTGGHNATGVRGKACVVHLTVMLEGKQEPSFSAVPYLSGTVEAGSNDAAAIGGECGFDNRVPVREHGNRVPISPVPYACAMVEAGGNNFLVVRRKFRVVDLGCVT